MDKLSFISMSYNLNNKLQFERVVAPFQKNEGHVDIGAGTTIPGAVTADRHAMIGADAVLRMCPPAQQP